MDYAELTRLLDAHKQSITTQLAETKDALAEFKTKGFVDPETKEKLVRLESKGEEITNAYKDLREKELKTLKDENAQLRKDVDDVATRLNRKTVNGGMPGFEGMTTYGQAFVESKEFLEWRARGKQGPVSVEFPKGHYAPSIPLTPGRESKVSIQPAPVTPGTQGQWLAVPPYFAPGLHRPPDLALVMRKVIPSAPISSDSIRYLREKAPYDYSTYTADYQVNYGDKKKTSTINYETMSLPVSTIAHYIKVPTQMLDDAPALQGDINNRLMFGLARKEDYELVYGDGASGHIYGIMPQATAFNKTAFDTAHPGAISIDYLAGMLMQLTQSGYMATASVLSASSWWAMALLKSATGVYYLGGPVGAPGAAETIWGIPLYIDYQMTAGSALVGDFQMGAEIFDRQTATIAVANQNEDDFVKNLITIRAEERLALAVFLPGAFISNTALSTFSLEAHAGAPGLEGGADRSLGGASDRLETGNAREEKENARRPKS